MAFGFLTFLLFGFYFVMCPFFLRFCQVQKVFYHQEFNHYLQIKHKKNYIIMKETSPQSWFFLVFVTIFEK